jgi:hypothetical protein
MLMKNMERSKNYYTDLYYTQTAVKFAEHSDVVLWSVMVVLAIKEAKEHNEGGGYAYGLQIKNRPWRCSI